MVSLSTEARKLEEIITSLEAKYGIESSISKIENEN